MNRAFSFFGDSTAQVKQAVTAAVQATGAVVEKNVRLHRLRQRASWSGWRILEVGTDQYAMVLKDFEGERYPIHGVLGINEVEQFVRCCENRLCW